MTDTRKRLIDMVQGSEDDRQLVIICDNENGDRTYYNVEGEPITPTRMGNRPTIHIGGKSMLESLMKLRDL